MFSRHKYSIIHGSDVASLSLSISIFLSLNLLLNTSSSPPHPQKLFGYPLHFKKSFSDTDNTPPKNVSSLPSKLYLVPLFPKCIGLPGYLK